jgi:hypothetical protein
VNGEVVKTIKPANRKGKNDVREHALDEKVKIDGSAWLAVRCFEDRPDGRVRFAHTGPVHVEVPGKPVRPRKVEIDYLIERVETQLERNAELLSREALDEYRDALRVYREIAKNAR